MAMQKAYSRINWENYPSENTALNETNLNRTDSAIDIIDDRVITLDTEKLEKTEAFGLVKSVDVSNATGVMTVTYFNGTQTTYQTAMNKIAINFSFDPNTQKITIENKDGTTSQVDLSAFVTQYEFVNTATVVFSVSSTGKVQANVPNGAITEEKLQPNYLADIRVSEANAANSEARAEADATLSKSWATGDTGTREGEDTNNSRFFALQSESSKNQAAEIEQKAQELLDAAIEKVANARFWIDFETGYMYCESDAYIFQIDYTTGQLTMEVRA